MTVASRMLAFAGVLCCAVGPLSAAELTDYFEKHIRPVLVDRCYSCHSIEHDKAKGKLLLDSREGMLRGGETGPALVPNQPDKSLLLTALSWTDKNLQMPPKEPLTKEQITHFRAWIQMGAPDPRVAKVTDTTPPPAPGPYDWAKARQHWSYRPLTNPPVPAIRNANLATSPIDHFILANQERKNLQPVALADRRTLIRRATFDLTGLPPTPAEVDAFVNDPSPSAFQQVVERLLAGPAYGERWGRHWLDLVRYADTSGCNSDFPVPDLYKYRNWVIDAFSRNKPLDQFLREQVAGDLMPAANEADRREKVTATGYIALSRRFGSRNNEFHLTIEDTLDNLFRVGMGISMSCARCHDHKFDPVPTTDYYALYGIFASTKYAFPGTEIFRHTRDFAYFVPAEELAEIRGREAELAKLPTTIEKLRSERTLVTKKEAAGEINPKRTLAMVKADLADADAKLKQLENMPLPEDKAFAVHDGTPTDAQVQRKGDPTMKGDKVERRFLTLFGGERLPPDVAKAGSGRLQLAHWLTDPSKNPLTPRVMANRIWQYHFGRGLVTTPNDFGARGKPPTHPELLDHLATRLIESGWDVKAMHREIMRSRTYQLAGSDDPSNFVLDPGNESYWRFNRRRLSAEEVRDTMLTISGTLDAAPGGGHPFPPEADYKYTQHRPFVAAYPSSKRGIYLMQQRIRKHPFLETFDGADTNSSTADRPLSITPLQALYMMNDPDVHQYADGLAVRVNLAHPTDADRIAYAYHLAYGRAPSPDETQASLAFLSDMREKLKSTKVPWDQHQRQAFGSLARVIFASNEFFFVD